MISLDNYGFIQKQSWSNSARTDKGVHAAAQVISLKASVTTPNEDLDVLRERINDNLPTEIRVLDVVKASNKFTAKTARDKVSEALIGCSWKREVNDRQNRSH